MADHAFHHITAPPARFRSFPSFLTMMSLDKVFSRGHVKVDDVRIVRNRLTRAASDHLPLVVDFDLSGERPG
jgi:endonuclease/exonuclease/phosphatase family metal-dependent hydrolase